MAQNSHPLPLVCVGRLRKVAEGQEQLLAPHLAYTGIIDLENFSPQTLRVLLASLNPHPVGVLVGGGVSVDVQDEVEKVVREHQAAGGFDLKFVRVPVGLRERVGAAEADQWLRDALGKAFGVVWLTFASLLSEVATIDPSSSPPRVPNRSASRRGPTPSSSAHSTPRPASRQSQVTNQIYQFALGYPQTPPDTSSDLDPFGPSIDAKSLGGGNSMGSFLFTWDHPASQVYVTGTFDDWARSVKLERKADRFEKIVELPLANEKIYYKFVVDGNWTTDHTAPQESDDSNNVNNVLLPENITGPQKPSDSAAAGMMSGVTPHSTTVGLASNVPKESQRAEREVRPDSASSDIPGGYPETPFHDAKEFAVDPIPATSGAGNPVALQPGDKVPHPSKLTENTIDSKMTTDKESYEKAGGTDAPDQTFGVAPIPATSGAGNPISLQPGDKVPHHSEFTSNTIGSSVTTDKDSYEKAGGTDIAAPYQTGGVSRDMSSMPPVSGTMIPESSLPMGQGALVSEPGYTIQSAGANSTTAALAGQVPLEPRGVPTLVSDSQHEAGVDPEASGNREAVKEKTAMEKELESKVPEEPATTEGTSGSTQGTKSKDAGIAAEMGGVAAGGAAAGAYAAYGSHGLPASIQQSIDQMNKDTSATTPIAPTVPDVVQESITESHQSPEAAGSKTMVEEKSAMEKDLLSKVTKEDNAGEPAPSSTAALTETAPTATGSDNLPPKDPAPNTTAAPLTETPPTATGTEKVPPKDPAPITTAAAPAQTPAANNSMKQAVKSQPDSRDISPMSKPINPQQTQPTVTTGVGSSSAPPKSETPAQAAAASASKSSPVSNSSAATDKKSKRASGFFGKLKSKFSDKDKK